MSNDNEQKTLNAKEKFIKEKTVEILEEIKVITEITFDYKSTEDALGAYNLMDSTTRKIFMTNYYF